MRRRRSLGFLHHSEEKKKMVNATSSRHSSSSLGIARRTESSVSDKLSSKTPLLGLKLYVVIGICLGCLIAALILFLLCFWRRKRKIVKKNESTIATTTTTTVVPITLKEIFQMSSMDSVLINGVDDDDEEKKRMVKKDVVVVVEEEEEKKNRVIGNGRRSEEESIVSVSSPSSSSVISVEVPNMGWGRWYTLRELEFATGGFSDENVIGEGGYGVVYRGNLPDNSVVAVKNLLNKKGQAEKEFKVEVEVIGKVRHKNLVGLIGYCAEGVQRMLVYEYVENGNLEQWLHGDIGPVSPLTWDIRIKIAIGTAKGLAYLHEGLEPKVIHRDIKSSNILLDRRWNAKVSDFGLAKLLESDTSYVTTRVMGTFGCVAPEYASTGMLSEGSDVYSFGVLLMELISGRSPVDYARRAGEVNLVDWFKGLVASRRGEEVLDPLIEVHPSSRALKRVILVCLRCIDLDAHKRPKMGQVVHMLEADEFPFRTDNRLPRETSPLRPTGAGGPSAVNRIPLPPKSAGER